MLSGGLTGVRDFRQIKSEGAPRPGTTQLDTMVLSARHPAVDRLEQQAVPNRLALIGRWPIYLVCWRCFRGHINAPLVSLWTGQPQSLHGISEVLQ